MKKRRRKRKERYSIIITSQTDARKKSLVFSITRRVLIISLCTVIVTVIISAGVALFSSYKASGYEKQIAQLEEQINSQTACTKTYAEESVFSDNYRRETGMDRVVSNTDEISSVESKDAYNDGDEPYPMDNGFEADVMKKGEAHLALTNDYTEYEEASVSILMKEAITLVESEFQARIYEQIGLVIEDKQYDEINILYDEDSEGDSETVNNWADVLSVFAAETLRDDQELLSISYDELELLSSIYDEMNEITIYTRVAADEAMGEVSAKEAIGPYNTVVVLTVYVSVNSLTYSEGAELHDFDREQASRLKELMSPDYYLYFSELLEIDIFDGMEYDDVKEIIENLPEGTKSSAIVKAALVRLGHPYSKARRGSGNYVDCSYFTWWAYNQAGISIPTSSVEQARYCYNNGYKIEKTDLQPGDLIFWSKKSCHCGRWHEIHHAGIYLGDNKIIDASSRKGRVVIRKLWGENGATWRIFMYARPY